MTDRIKGLTVILDQDYRDDDVEAIVNAIKMIKGVIKVDTHVVHAEDYFVAQRSVMDFFDKIYKVYKEHTK